MQLNQQDPPPYPETPIDDTSSTGNITPQTTAEIEPFPPSDLFHPTNLNVLDKQYNRWNITGFSQLNQKEHGPTFTCGGARWRILLFPAGNRNNGVLSVFLENMDSAEKTDADRWHVCAEFVIALICPSDDTIYKSQTAHHRFSPSCTDWGFSTFFKVADLQVIGEKSFLENDNLVLAAVVRVVEDETGYLWHNFENWDSKTETGYVGLKNQGATCYMNSLLQSLYFTNYFRRATFEIPTENDHPEKSVALALQRVFYNLQHSNKAVGTTELTKSFGWDTMDSFMQHDVQEFNRVLQDNLESKMKGTKAEGAIIKLFVGKMKSYIKCINVDFESSRVEDYYDIQLNVKSCKNLYESFQNYCEVETLEGENKYMAEGFGLQDARKGVIFKSFPPVLHLQLKRFEYDMERDAMVKINDRHEYPEIIDLDEFLETDDTTATVQHRYHLHGVLVHMGDLHGGHYYALLRPQVNGKWFKFDDDKVTPASLYDVFESNFGGESIVSGGVKRIMRFCNAYMLVYIRQDQLEHVLRPIEENDIPSHLTQRIQQEQLEHAKLAKAFQEEQSFYSIHILTDAIISKHCGYDLCNAYNKAYELTEFETIKVKKGGTCGDFKKLVATTYNIPENSFHLWGICERQNKTYRVDAILQEPDSTLFDIIRAKYSKYQSDAIFYLDIIELETNSKSPIKSFFSRPEEPNASMTLFIKWFDHSSAHLKYMGKLVVKKGKTISEYIPLIQDRVQVPHSIPITIYEEIKPRMIERVNPKHTFQQGELGDGDILIIEREWNPADVSQFPLPNILAYFDAYENQVLLVFKSLLEQEQEDMTLLLSKKDIYPMIVDLLARKLNVSWDHILLFVVDRNHKIPVKYSNSSTLWEIIGSPYYPSSSYILYYQVLDMTIMEYEMKQSVRVSFLDSSLKEQGPFEFFIDKNSTAKDIIELVLGRIKKNADDSGFYRLYEVAHFKIYKVCQESDLLSSIPPQSFLYVEEVHTDELDRQEADRIVQVIHYNKDPFAMHSIPFYFTLKAGEMFSETKKRLQNRIGISDKDFGKIKFTLVNKDSQIKAVEDDDILADLEFTKFQFLGMDHIDRSSRSSRLGGTEKAIKIFN